DSVLLNGHGLVAGTKWPNRVTPLGPSHSRPITKRLSWRPGWSVTGIVRSRRSKRLSLAANSDGAHSFTSTQWLLSSRYSAHFSPAGSTPRSVGSGSACLISSFWNVTLSLVAAGKRPFQRAKYDLPQASVFTRGVTVTTNPVAVRRMRSVTRPRGTLVTERNKSLVAPAGRLGAGTENV